MRFSRAFFLLIVTFGLGMPGPSDAQTDSEADDEENPKTIAELTAESDRFDGLFILFRDRNTGEARLLIKPEQLGREYIYFAVSMDGVVQGGHFRGSFRENRIVPDADAEETFALGELNEDKSKITTIRSYPLNTDVQFAADIRGDVNTFRQNLQTEYVHRLIAIVEAENDYDRIDRLLEVNA